MHKIKIKEKPIKLTGHVEARLYDANIIKTYEDYCKYRDSGRLDEVTLQKTEGKNRIVDVGIQQIIDLFLGANVLYPAFCQNGTNNTAVTAGDTGLNTPTGSRVAVNYKYRSGLSAKIDTFFTSADQNATWAEVALFTASTGGIMFSRKIYAATFAKSTSNTATVTWTWTLSSS